MDQKSYHLTDFIQKENFELRSYITHLIDHYKTRFYDEKALRTGWRKINLEKSS